MLALKLALWTLLAPVAAEYRIRGYEPTPLSSTYPKRRRIPEHGFVPCMR